MTNKKMQFNRLKIALRKKISAKGGCASGAKKSAKKLLLTVVLVGVIISVIFNINIKSVNAAWSFWDLLGQTETVINGIEYSYRTDGKVISYRTNDNGTVGKWKLVANIWEDPVYIKKINGKDTLGQIDTDGNFTPLKGQNINNLLTNPDKNQGQGNTSTTSLGDLLGQLLSWILYYIAVGLGWILMLLMKVMLAIAIFNNFLNVRAVTEGWTIARDICNNFFIVFMMIMAVGVTLHLPNYQWRSMLPKILLAAVLINFSKMFTGILIDVSQVLMLTFAAPLATVYGYNIILAAMGLPSAFQLEQALGSSGSLAKGSGSDNLTPAAGISWPDIIAALLFAIIVTIVAIVVVAVICIVLVYRIIMLWFLVILSPLPFLASAASNIKGLSGLSSEWMSNLTNMLVVGPAMMFFLYLSFMTMVAFNDLNKNTNTNILATTGGGGTALNVSGQATKDYAPLTDSNMMFGSDTTKAVNLSNMASPNGVITFLMVVGLLVVSLMMGQKFGQAAGKFAGQAQGWLGRAAKKYSGFNLAASGAKRAAQLPGATVRTVAGTLGTGTLGTVGAVTRGLGAVTGLKGLQRLGEFEGAWRQDVLTARRNKRAARFTKFAKKVGVGDNGMKKWGEFTNTALGQGVKILGTAGVTGVAGATAAAGVGALATMASGGTLAPVIAGIAAAYLGGGSRLTEMLVGSTGETIKNRRENKRAELNKQVTDRQADTAKDTKASETDRDNKIKTANEAMQKEITAEDDKLKAETKAAEDELKLARETADRKLQQEVAARQIQTADEVKELDRERDEKLKAADKTRDQQIAAADVQLAADKDAVEKALALAKDTAEEKFVIDQQEAQKELELSKKRSDEGKAADHQRIDRTLDQSHAIEQKLVADIDGSKVDLHNQGDIKSFHKLLQSALKSDEMGVLKWKEGQLIRPEMLDKAKEIARKSNDYTQAKIQVSAVEAQRTKSHDDIDKMRKDELRRAEAKFNGSVAGASQRRDTEVNQAEANRNLRVNQATSAQQAAIQAAQNDNRIAQQTAKNDQQKKTQQLRDQENKDIEALDSKHKTEVGQAKADSDSRINRAKTAHDTAVDAAKEDNKIAREDANDVHNVNVKQYQDKEEKDLQSVRSQLSKIKPLGGFLSDYLPYAHPNWVSQLAAKEATKSTTAAQNTVRKIGEGEEKLEEFNKSNFISEDDNQTERQAKTFELWAEDEKTLAQAVSRLQEILADTNVLEKKHINNLAGLARGLAAQQTAGKDTSKFEMMIQLLDQINLKTGKKTVGNYAAGMQPKT